jgi:tRNA G37 N-methylase Trm5
MGLLPMDFLEFLPTAIKAIQKKGKILCHYTAPPETPSKGIELALQKLKTPSLKLELLSTNQIKKISKNIHHFVAMISCEKY